MGYYSQCMYVQGLLLSLYECEGRIHLNTCVLSPHNVYLCEGLIPRHVCVCRRYMPLHVCVTRIYAF